MNVAIILAGGSGQRMNQDIPKQFINVYDKPVIVYTLESFEKHPEIDAIEVVCLDGWHEILKAYAMQFNISKLKWVVSGGETGQESIRNGVYALEEHCKEDDIVIIHDGIRPLDESVLSDVIVNVENMETQCRPFHIMSRFLRLRMKYLPRNIFPRDIEEVSTPQAYKYGKLLWAYKKPLLKELVFMDLLYQHNDG